MVAKVLPRAHRASRCESGHGFGQEETFGSLAPFGGVKQSGVGRKGTQYGIENYQIIQYIQYITMMDV